jgi:hypothetical protein
VKNRQKSDQNRRILIKTDLKDTPTGKDTQKVTKELPLLKFLQPAWFCRRPESLLRADIFRQVDKNVCSISPVAFSACL